MQNRKIKISFSIRITIKALGLLCLIVTFIACAPKAKIKYYDRIIMPTLPKELQDYAVFLKKNNHNENLSKKVSHDLSNDYKCDKTDLEIIAYSSSPIRFTEEEYNKYAKKKTVFL